MSTSAPPADRADSAHADPVIVVGGGIAGLAAAHALAAAGRRVTLLEASGRLGGKLRRGEVAGTTLDLGAEAMLARRPEAVDLARAVGLGEALRAPAVSGGALWTGGAVRPLPPGQLMGVPAGPEGLAGVISPAGLARIAEEERLPPVELGEDVAIGAHVAARFGREVVDRLVEPLLGGVYAGDAHRISLRAALPPLFAAQRRTPTLGAAVRAVQAEARRAAERRAAEGLPTPPPFLGIEGGVGRLPDAVAGAVRAAGGEVRTGVAVRALRRTGDGWLLECADGAVRRAAAVVVALPAAPAAALLRAEVPRAAVELDAVEYASMALCVLAFRRADLAHTPQGSGFLVPPVEVRTVKAATFAANKWDWVAAQDPDLFVLRTSIGRYGEEGELARDDAELVDRSLADLRAAVGLSARPVDRRVVRWTDGLPQYPVGHLARVERIRAAVAERPGLAVCGAVYEGVGIPACVAGGRRAAAAVAEQLGPVPAG